MIKDHKKIRLKNYLKEYLRTTTPQFARLIHSHEATCKEKSPKTKILFPLLPAFYILIDSRRQNFLPNKKRFTL